MQVVLLRYGERYFIGESNSAEVQLASRSMRLLQIESSEDGHLRRQQVWSGRSREVAEYQKRVDPNDKQAQSLLDEMRAHIKKLEEMRKNEDPRLSFSTPEFKEAQRMFTDNLKKNFGKPVEWGMVKDHPWSTPQLRKLDVPVDVDGKPWPLGNQGQPIVKS